jgi:hypothetical protein
LPGALTPNEVYLLCTGVGFTPEQAKTMVAIAYDESGFKPKAVSRPNTNGSKDYGLFQINTVHFRETAFVKNGWNATTLLDAHTNALAARTVFNAQGFKAWSTYNHGLSAIALGFGKSSDVAGAAPNLSSGIGISNPIDGITSAIGGFTSTITKIASNIGILIVAIVLIILGVVLLSRNSIGKGVAKAVLPV